MSYDFYLSHHATLTRTGGGSFIVTIPKEWVLRIFEWGDGQELRISTDKEKIVIEELKL